MYDLDCSAENCRESYAVDLNPTEFAFPIYCLKARVFDSEMGRGRPKPDDNLAEREACVPVGIKRLE